MEHPDEKRIKELAKKWLDGTISDEERRILDLWYDEDEEKPVHWTGDDLDEESLKKRMYADLLDKITVQPKERPLLKMRTYAAAASVLLAISLGYLIFSRLPQKTKPVALAGQTKSQPVMPGGNKAVLTLANGHQINLSEEKKGVVLTGEEIRYDDGVIISQAASSGKVREHFNTISTPRGGKYEVVLPDGSKVWLNAASWIRFPAVFEGIREVELSGEAYFEVKQLTRGKGKVPFIVRTESQTVEVVGTEFNISAYPDEVHSQTTLIGGAVLVGKTTSQTNGKPAAPVLLAPGEQAILAASGNIRVSAADIPSVTAWKNDLFRFKGLDVRSAMKHICRWYDVDITYKGSIGEGTLTGYISRDLPVSNVLNMVEEISGVSFSLEGRHITAKTKKD